MMLIEELFLEIKKLFAEYGYEAPVPANTTEIAEIERAFFIAYQMKLPDAYIQILSFSNGIIFNGLTIWPTQAHGKFHESLLEANEALHESFSEQYIYFGVLDEELYVYDKKTGFYKALELVGQAEWNVFSNAEAMFRFMLERAID